MNCLGFSHVHVMSVAVKAVGAMSDSLAVRVVKMPSSSIGPKELLALLPTPLTFLGAWLIAHLHIRHQRDNALSVALAELNRVVLDKAYVRVVTLVPAGSAVAVAASSIDKSQPDYGLGAACVQEEAQAYQLLRLNLLERVFLQYRIDKEPNYLWSQDRRQMRDAWIEYIKGIKRNRPDVIDFLTSRRHEYDASFVGWITSLAT